jgi:transposase-like protein
VTDNGSRRRPRVLSPETKWEIFLQIASREISQADAARKWHVDVSTIIGIRRTVKDAALAALAARPGRPAKERNWELEEARRELSQLTEAVKAQAIELALLRGKAGWA